jgi:post-segregation antitoxin (ccd killing protein)
MLFTLKRKFLEISLDLQTALAAEANEAERQWLEERLNIVKLVCSEQEHECRLF